MRIPVSIWGFFVLCPPPSIAKKLALEFLFRCDLDWHTQGNHFERFWMTGQHKLRITKDAIIHKGSQMPKGRHILHMMDLGEIHPRYVQAVSLSRYAHIWDSAFSKLALQSHSIRTQFIRLTLSNASPDTADFLLWLVVHQEYIALSSLNPQTLITLLKAVATNPKFELIRDEDPPEIYAGLQEIWPINVPIPYIDQLVLSFQMDILQWVLANRLLYMISDDGRENDASNRVFFLSMFDALRREDPVDAHGVVIGVLIEIPPARYPIVIRELATVWQPQNVIDVFTDFIDEGYPLNNIISARSLRILVLLVLTNRRWHTRVYIIEWMIRQDANTPGHHRIFTVDTYARIVGQATTFARENFDDFDEDAANTVLNFLARVYDDDDEDDDDIPGIRRNPPVASQIS